MKSLFRSIVMALLILCLSALVCTAGTTPPQSLKIALVHFGVKYKDPELNLKALLDLHRKAAQKGAKLILNTELAVSGYSFTSRRDIAPFTETDQGKTIQAMGRLAKELGVYIGITFPERDPLTLSYYNGAFVLDPQGRLVCKYRKIYGEKRWARPGNPYQKGTFDTPWGRIGVAICADSYFGLIPRTMALKEVDLLWVPANWPPTGTVNPLDVWKIRALENGFYLAACNRTGKDRIMDCTKAVSSVINPKGQPLFSRASEDSALFFVDIPLDANGVLDNTRRRQLMASREIDLYRQIYLDPWVENLTLYYQLPKTGLLDLHCLVAPQGQISSEELEKAISEKGTGRPALWVLPEQVSDTLNRESLLRIAKARNLAFALSFAGDGENPAPCLVTPQGIKTFMEPDTGSSQEFPFKLLHYGPAAIAMVPMASFRHPELGVILAKLGCDLVLISQGELSSNDLLVGRIRALNGFAVVACGKSSAQIACMKGLHGNMDLKKQLSPGVSVYTLDTAITRKKSFYNRIDYDILLKSTGQNTGIGLLEKDVFLNGGPAKKQVADGKP